jgi:hypothetical protein
MFLFFSLQTEKLFLFGNLHEHFESEKLGDASNGRTGRKKKNGSLKRIVQKQGVPFSFKVS